VSEPRKRVLYLDDEEMLVPLVRRLLALEGYEVIGFVDGAEALAAFRADPTAFDAVITDQSMPKMDGLEFGAAVHAARPEIPIVLVSGAVPNDLHTRAAAVGIQTVLYKATSITDMCKALDALLRA
jgi:two-component system cell cycle sensor histidine kinase/response regulator CckA